VNIVFIGSSKFGLKCLSVCLDFKDLSIKGIVTSPQKFSISYSSTGVKNILYRDFSKFAADHSIEVRSIKSSMNDPKLFNDVAKWKPDAFLVVGWYHMIPKLWRDLAPAYGLHASLLPDYSGGAPLVWAIINGESKTGITMFKMDEGVDSGPIVGQSEERIFPDDTISTLYARIEVRGIELLQDVLPKLALGKLKLKAQNELNRRILPQRSPEDGQIDWRKDALYVDRFIRAQTKPYPGAFTIFDGKPLHIWKSSVSTENIQSMPGTVTRKKDGFCYVSCGKGAILMHEISYKRKSYLGNQINKIVRSTNKVVFEN